MILQGWLYPTIEVLKSQFSWEIIYDQIGAVGIIAAHWPQKTVTKTDGSPSHAWVRPLSANSPYPKVASAALVSERPGSFDKSKSYTYKRMGEFPIKQLVEF